MSGSIAPRYQGRISTWKDDQGFGFITPKSGEPAVFVHISSFAARGRRPAVMDIVTYALSANEKGQLRAENVAHVRQRALSRSALRTGSFALFSAAAFLAFLAFCTLAGKLAPPVLWSYLGMSALAFIAYAHDKSSARNGQWRVRESTLHLLGIAGGWPGALYAQQIFRHKSKKASFRREFWLTVIINCGVLGWLLSPSGSSALRAMLGTA